ncbi:hypothetical protein RRG08_001051 [Elysia crispata]|uniref:Uncharacterized protein n=1 Tax=Elysia crispata TaxID=231223 RepID=A0AAE1AVU3_9GAST|nr:hypothetical protein RRG08_001051 [Elysia crispata]
MADEMVDDRTFTLWDTVTLEKGFVAIPPSLKPNIWSGARPERHRVSRLLAARGYASLALIVRCVGEGQSETGRRRFRNEEEDCRVRNMRLGHPEVREEVLQRGFSPSASTVYC